jgi:hypothetical protein
MSELEHRAVAPDEFISEPEEAIRQRRENKYAFQADIGWPILRQPWLVPHPTRLLGSAQSGRTRLDRTGLFLPLILLNRPSQRLTFFRRECALSLPDDVTVLVN